LGKKENDLKPFFFVYLQSDLFEPTAIVACGNQITRFLFYWKFQFNFTGLLKIPYFKASI